MADQRWIPLSTEKPTRALYVRDTQLYLDVYGSAPTGATAFEVCGTPGVNLYIIHNAEVSKISYCVHRWPLDPRMEVVVTMDALSSQVDEDKVRVSYFKENGETAVAKAILQLTCIEISLDADITRSGTVTRRMKNKKNWTWGPGGRGAILLVNCDRDDPGGKDMDYKDKEIQSFVDRRDMSLMILTTRGPDDVFEDNKVVLHISKSDSDKLHIFHALGEELAEHKLVLGSEQLSYTVGHRRGQTEHVFYVEGLAFPDVNFPGLLSVHATLIEGTTEVLPEVPIFNDTVVFRVAPWIMTPNTLQPVALYACRVKGNEDFLDSLSKLAQAAGCEWIICPETDNQGDRWIQDEMEFGYVQAPHKTFPVVFDSPRNGKLRDYPFKKILGPDFGYVTREPTPPLAATEFDYGGNIEVSPPVTVKGKEYPLGRILIGSCFPSSTVREMTQVSHDFLYAQQVQSPIELYSGWLYVGHVDEFLTFVPASDRKGFRLLLASPSACFKLLKEKEEEGHGDAQMFEGVKRQDSISIRKILGDRFLRKYNEYCQKCIDWNRDVLKEELELTEDDILDIPQLFSKYGKAEAYFPDMVNMVVLGKHLGIPKPFGPMIHGQCCLEEAVRCLLEPLGLSCTFIDDFEDYHIGSGEVHCGTNVRREPFSFKWWNMRP